MPKPNPLWTRVDDYLVSQLVPADPDLDAALDANHAAGLPAIDVSPTQGRFLHLLVAITGARRILEIGTLGAYSTICLAKALPPDGTLITLEFDPRHATVARSNIAQAGLSELVELRVGAAAESLARLHQESAPSFDLIFIDADKPNNPTYLDWSLKLAHPGTVILVDNVIRDGQIADSANTDPSVSGTRTMFAAIAANPRLQATALQTVGSKGYDGFALIRVLP